MYADIYQVPNATLSVFKVQDAPLDEPLKFMEFLQARPGRTRMNLSRLSEFVKHKCKTIAAAEKLIASGHFKDPPKINNMGVPGAEKTRRRGLARPPEHSAEERQPAAQPIPPPSNYEELTHEGLEFEARRLRTELNEAYDLYTKLKKDDPIGASAAWKTWKDMLQQYTALAKAAPDIELRAKNVVKLSDAMATWQRACAEAFTAMTVMARRVATHPKAKNADEVTLEQLVLDEVTKVMTAFHRGDIIEA